MMVVMVIAAKSSAARFGPGRLVVDGTDETLRRKTTFACHPTAGQQDALHGLLGVCCEVYNAALAERRDAWRSAGVTVTLFEQFGQLTELRGLRDDVFVWGVQPLRGALRRLDEAYGAFLRRCAAGQTPGLPRFRSRRRFDTACWDQPSSWRVDLDARTLRLQGVGDIRLPKSARRQLGRLTSRGGTPTRPRGTCPACCGESPPARRSSFAGVASRLSVSCRSSRRATVASAGIGGCSR